MTRNEVLRNVAALDDVRQALNGTNALASQSGAYGKVAEAMILTLAYQFGEGMAREIYQDMIESGNDVKRAVESVYAQNEITS